MPTAAAAGVGHLLAVVAEEDGGEETAEDEDEEDGLLLLVRLKYLDTYLLNFIYILTFMHTSN